MALLPSELANAGSNRSGGAIVLCEPRFQAEPRRQMKQIISELVDALRTGS